MGALLNSIIESCREKPRRHSRLKTLPASKQAEIFGHSCMHRLVETVEWLRSCGIATSKSRLSEFLAWWREQQAIEIDISTALAAVEKARSEQPQLSDQELDTIGINILSISLMRRKDSQRWLALFKAKLAGKAQR